MAAPEVHESNERCAASSDAPKPSSSTVAQEDGARHAIVPDSPGPVAFRVDCGGARVRGAAMPSTTAVTDRD
jgi:hypothetical protein